MKMNMDALKSLELKLAKYRKENGAIAEHKSANTNCYNCKSQCLASCSGSCSNSCSGSKR